MMGLQLRVKPHFPVEDITNKEKRDLTNRP